MEATNSQDDTLRFKDLDTGKEYNVQQVGPRQRHACPHVPVACCCGDAAVNDAPLRCANCSQKYTIRDLTTGQVFVLDSHAPNEAQPDSELGSPRSAQVTEIVTGKEMSLEEFDQVLGLHTVLEVRPSPCPSLCL